MKPVDVIQGSGPLVLGMPHCGTHVPEDIFNRLTPLGQTLGDTDWHVDRLYAGLLDNVTIVRANFHRYVIDANRDPSGVSLYPGQNTTGLVPLTNFDGEPLWMNEPEEEEIEARRKAWHEPYHAALAGELERVRHLNGAAILYDCHSIRSVIPFLFEGVLPDFNIGTNGGITCAPQIEHAVTEICGAASGYTSIVNGRFKGGWTTRHYGRPEQGIHAIQMELVQKTHLATEAVPFDYDEEKAKRLRVHLAAILEKLAGLAPTLSENTGANQ
ncbi:N-formylglutamate deformylase [Salaquimonas pukyongi]|uniref:N-formylglutamate deformylase n=1 Tax=Salaquimonas pukyongi TaxID=2712698 RepID=UPI00096B6ACF|nr:N-formylglutamate deformylase [Salaquimonas pukyongi]